MRFSTTSSRAVRPAETRIVIGGGMIDAGDMMIIGGEAGRAIMTGIGIEIGREIGTEIRTGT